MESGLDITVFIDWQTFDEMPSGTAVFINNVSYTTPGTEIEVPVQGGGSFFCEVKNPDESPEIFKVDITSDPNFQDIVQISVFFGEIPDLVWSLQITGWAETPARRLQDTFSCPNGCVIPFVYVNDNFCDCSDCADEVNWNCDTCGAFDGDDGEEATDVGVGVGVGVGTAIALGIGLGVGLGTGVGSGVGSGSAASAAVASLAVLSAEGSMRLRVKDGSLLQQANFANALKDTVARLAGPAITSAMVELILNCARALRRLEENPLRRLQDVTVGVCFEVRVSDSAAEEVCQTLSGLDAGSVSSVLQSELDEAGIDPGQVSVVGYDAQPNPNSYNPLNRSDLMSDGSIFVPPGSVDFGARLRRLILP
mgnify:CR=1 FL=1